MDKTSSYQKSKNSIEVVNINKSVQARIGALFTAQGKQFYGKYNIETYFCDSVNDIKKLSNMPQLITVNDLPMISFSMQSWQILSEDGKLLFPGAPVEMSEKIPSNFDPNKLNQFAAYFFDHLLQKWRKTGGLKIDFEKKEFSYSIPNPSKQELINVLDNMGNYKQAILFQSQQEQTENEENHNQLKELLEKVR